MIVFQHYARYYDLLYRDKDYAAEAAFVHSLVQRHAPGAASVFELGCGTGRHAVEFARLGYRVAGIDLSADMVARSYALHATQPAEMASRLTAEVADVRSYRSGAQFDVVLSLFHVINYQTTRADLEGMMATAAELTRPDGVFFFDFWYGPAVLADPPTVRVRRMEDEVIAVTRIAEPESRPNENRVDVHYHIIVRDKSTGVCEEVKETHAMRYLFLPEIEMLLEQHGFELKSAGSWLDASRPLDSTTWYGYLLAKKLA